jgi:outer membrane protein assembly factor BamB/tRNA A-37 threonylcarbamoyl transferase component Bud32
MVTHNNDSGEAPEDKGLDTRRIRGLSQRLRQPLSIESNFPDEHPHAKDDEEGRSKEEGEDREEEVVVEEEGAQDLTTRTVKRLKNRVTRMSSGANATAVPLEGLLSEGSQLQKRYKVLGVIGVGGMGAVYKARDMRFTHVQRLCAVKEMVNTATDPQLREMIVRNFEREASILATLNHPAIPQVHDYFTEGSRSYLVLEYIHGSDLETLISETEGFFSEAKVIDWAVQLCDVLSYLHNHKPRPVVFRDLKPSNIMLDEHDRIRLVDFGIAKLFQSGEKGTMIGTEGYSPPEQYRGNAEPRGDIYALGATLHHLLSKQDPRMEPPFSFHERPIHKTNPTVSREFVEVLNRALEYDVNKRWGSAEEFKRALLNLTGVRGTGRVGRGETEAFTSGAVKPLWRFACEDEVRSGVALHDGLVYVPSYDHNVYALEAGTGKFVWKYPAEGGIGTTPWASDDLLVFGSTDGKIHAVEPRTGRPVWATPTKGKVYSSPVGEFRHVFVGSDDRNLYAIQQSGGRRAWTFTADGRIRTRPLVTENLIFFADQQGITYALGLNREVRWRFRARRGFLASPVMQEGLLFIGSLDWHLYALDVRSGWAAWRHRTNGPVVSTAAVWENLVFFGSADGYFYALDASDGRLVWRYETEAQITSSPAVYGENVYFGGVDGDLYCLDARAGKLRWRYKTDGPITASPIIEDGVIYIGSVDRYVYAIPA